MLKPQTGTEEDQNNVPMEKDETELELEKIVFGDDVSFHDNLKNLGRPDALEIMRETGLDTQDYTGFEDEDELEGVKDSDVGRWEILRI